MIPWLDLYQFLPHRFSLHSTFNGQRITNVAPTELQQLLSGVHSVMRVKLALAGEGGGARPPLLLHLTVFIYLFYYIYHHQ